MAHFLDRRLHTIAPVAAALAAAACDAVVCHAVAGQADGEVGRLADPRADPRANRLGDPLVDPLADSLADRLADLDAEADARRPAPAVRVASRALGRVLARLGRRAWPLEAWAALPTAPHHSIALGVAAAAAGLAPAAAAQVAAYLTITGPATAAQRLLSLDPLTVAALTANLCSSVDAVAAQAARDPAGPISVVSDPWFDLLAETHASREDRLFAS